MGLPSCRPRHLQIVPMASVEETTVKESSRLKLPSFSSGRKTFLADFSKPLMWWYPRWSTSIYSIFILFFKAVISPTCLLVYDSISFTIRTYFGISISVMMSLVIGFLNTIFLFLMPTSSEAEDFSLADYILLSNSNNILRGNNPIINDHYLYHQFIQWMVGSFYTILILSSFINFRNVINKMISSGLSSPNPIN